MRLRLARHRIVVSLFSLPICRGEMLLSSLYSAANTIIGRWGREWYLDLPGRLPVGPVRHAEHAFDLRVCAKRSHSRKLARPWQARLLAFFRTRTFGLAGYACKGCGPKQERAAARIEGQCPHSPDCI